MNRSIKTLLKECDPCNRCPIHDEKGPCKDWCACPSFIEYKELRKEVKKLQKKCEILEIALDFVNEIICSDDNSKEKKFKETLLGIARHRYKKKNELKSLRERQFEELIQEKKHVHKNS